MKKVYISCPMTVLQETLDKVIALVKQSGVDPMYWRKGSPYDPGTFMNIIQRCDAFVIILPGLAWSAKGQAMTSGSRKEMNIAYNAGVPIYLAYQNKYDGIGLYSVRIEAARTGEGVYIVSEITGLPSTRYNFNDFIGYNKLAGAIQDSLITSHNEESKAIDKIYGSGNGFISEEVKACQIKYASKQDVGKEVIKPSEDKSDNRLLLL